MTQISTSQLATDLGYMIADLPANVTAAAFITGTKTATMSELSAETMLMLAGNIDVKHYELVIALSDTTQAPAVTNRVGVTGQGESGATNYEVVSWRKSQDGVAYHIILKADHRN